MYAVSQCAGSINSLLASVRENKPTEVSVYYLHETSKPLEDQSGCFELVHIDVVTLLVFLCVSSL